MLPIALRPDGRRAVVVGGGNVAARKAEALVAAGFRVFAIAPAVDDRLRRLIEERGGELAVRPYRTGDADGALLVIAATGDERVDAQVVADARAARVLACDASSPELGDFSMPATVRVGELTVSVDSGAGSPAFSKRLARELALTLGPRYADAVANLTQMRACVKESFPKSERGDILRELAAKPVDELAAMNVATVVCASRGSALAMIQARWVAARLAQRGLASSMLGVTTAGDRDRERPIERLGVNVFVKELEYALIERRADYAVHSCKDLASEIGTGLRIAAISQRMDPRDAFCSERYESFDALPPGAVVGTSSPRRRAQLAALRPDLRYEDLRGNVDTRLRKLAAGEYDAIVLAMAGMERLRARAAHTVAFEPHVLVPAAGQGALAVEVRSDDERLVRDIRAAVNDERTELCVLCERAALRELRAGCSVPVGIHATLDGEAMTVLAAYASDGVVRRERATARVTGVTDAQALGTAIAAALAAEAHA